MIQFTACRELASYTTAGDVTSIVICMVFIAIDYVFPCAIPNENRQAG